MERNYHDDDYSYREEDYERQQQYGSRPYRYNSDPVPLDTADERESFWSRATYFLVGSNSTFLWTLALVIVFQIQGIVQQ
jgi:hypothetical protein